MPEQEKTKMKIQCPSCSSKLDVTDLKPFTVFSCPQCGSAVTVPMRFQAYVLEEYLESNGGIHRYRALDEKLDREVCVVICEASENHLHFHETFFTGEGKDVAIDGGGALYDLKVHRKS